MSFLSFSPSQHLNNLLENYLEPLKRETFLSNAEITALFGNIQEIVTFQRQFLQNLEEALEIEPDFHRFEHSGQFKVSYSKANRLKPMLETFTTLFHRMFSLPLGRHFYITLITSSCILHSVLVIVKHRKFYIQVRAYEKYFHRLRNYKLIVSLFRTDEGNQALQEFLLSKNPRQEHSSTLESYLIKPIQRILKYPLLLQQLKNLTDPYAEEHHHLIEALKGMEKVAEHINEMQRIHEEYGAIFDHLFRQHQKSCKQPIDLSPGEFCTILF